MKAIRPISLVVPGLLLSAQACEVSCTHTNSGGTGYAESANIAGGAIITYAGYSSSTATWITSAYNWTTDCSLQQTRTEVLTSPTFTTSMTRYQDTPACCNVLGAGSKVNGAVGWGDDIGC